MFTFTKGYSAVDMDLLQRFVLKSGLSTLLDARLRNEKFRIAINLHPFEIQGYNREIPKLFVH